MKLAIKVDVDTARGTKFGVPALAALFLKYEIPATFLFSLGPDNTGRAIKRIFRRGFFKKAMRTSVLQVYGIKTLCNGILWPGPHIGKRYGKLLRQIKAQGFEVGIHCYDHIRWQDGLQTISEEEVHVEFTKARAAFCDVFGQPATVAGAAGWQANAASLKAYDRANLLYASDARGVSPFFPSIGEQIFQTLQIPTTLPTLDEVLGRPEFPFENLTDSYCSWLCSDRLNVLTIHAELEGMSYYDWFEALLQKFKGASIQFISTEDYAHKLLSERKYIPIHKLIQGTIDGRSGMLALQGIEMMSS